MPVRERILTIGIYNSGKTYQWLTLAAWLKTRGVKFYAIDTDDAVERMLLGNKFYGLHYQRGGNVNYRKVYTWDEYLSASDWVLRSAKENDWIVMDMATTVWSAVQTYFITGIFGKDPGDYFMEQRKALRARGDKVTDSRGRSKDADTMNVLKGWLDWPTINKLYDDFWLPLVYQSPAHLYTTAGVSALSKDDDDDATKATFGAFGVKPAGQKNLGHQHQSVLWLTQRDSEHWEITTIKERERLGFDEPIRYDHTPLVNFPMQYMVGNARWPVA